DVNKPGTLARDLVGGVLGGTVVQGMFRIGDEVEILPGAKVKQDGQDRYEPLYAEITSLMSGSEQLEVAYPGGLIAVGTNLDPSLTKADGLIGNVVGKPGRLPEPLQEITLEYKLMERVVGVEKVGPVEPLRAGEALMINVGTALSLGLVSSVKGDVVHLKLRIPVVAEKGQRVAISRQYGGRWRLIGYGFVQ
ncbi:MAG: translation initiation factor IF-2 subunit gamma, partial [Thermofilum sp.]